MKEKEKRFILAKRIEVSTAGSYLCAAVVEQVKQLACLKCEVIVYDLNKNNSTTEWEQKSKAYGIQSIPSVAMGGKIIDLTKLKKESIKMDSTIFLINLKETITVFHFYKLLYEHHA